MSPSSVNPCFLHIVPTWEARGSPREGKVGGEEWQGAWSDHLVPPGGSCTHRLKATPQGRNAVTSVASASLQTRTHGRCLQELIGREQGHS